MTVHSDIRIRHIAQQLRQLAGAYCTTPHQMLESLEQWERVGRTIGAEALEIEQALDLIEQQAAESEQERRIERHRRAMAGMHAPRSIARYVLQTPAGERPFALAAVNPRLIRAVKIEIGKQSATARRGVIPHG